METNQTHCFNCKSSVMGDFCHQCGQRVRDNSDRSLGRLFGDFFTNIFFIDNRFFLSAWYLFRFPGRMTLEFLDGKRKKFISPVTLFLFFNLIYFIVNPLTDYSISLYDQICCQPYSGEWIKEYVRLKLETQEMDFQRYVITYQNMSDNVSKSIMIINIPLIAFFVYLMAFKRRPFYYDSLIFTFHFFSLFIFTWVMLSWVSTPVSFLFGGEDSIISNIIFMLFTTIIPLIYAILSMKKFMDIRWYWAILAGVGVMIAVVLANSIYRLIIFVITFGIT